MYLVYESNYGELLYECDSTDIIGLYDSKEKAIKKAKEVINNNLSYGNWVIDKERNNIDEDNFVRFFYGEQENWGDYFEIIIKKIEVE